MHIYICIYIYVHIHIHSKSIPFIAIHIHSIPEFPLEFRDVQVQNQVGKQGTSGRSIAESLSQ